MATPILKKEYLDMIPDFCGEPTLLNRFVTICDKIVAKFFVTANTEDFQNEYLYSSILAKIKGPALDIVTSSNSYAWPDVRQVLLTSYLDKRDCFTLNIEMAEMKQEIGESPFVFYERIQKILNLQISYFINKEAKASGVLCEYAQKLALRVLLRGLHEPIGSLMRTKNPSTLGEALSMLTNDFQFKTAKVTNLSQNNKNQFNLRPYYAFNQQFQKPNPPQQFKNYPIQTFNPQLQRPMFVRNQNGFQNPQFRTQPNQNLNGNMNFNQPRSQNPNQPTPMSISTRNSGPPRKNPKLYQMTGQNTETSEIGDEICDTNQTNNLDDYNELQFETLCLDDFQNSPVSEEQVVVEPQNENGYFLGATGLETGYR
jgi:hypothetical protein